MINEIRYKKDEYGNIHIMPYFEVKINAIKKVLENHNTGLICNEDTLQEIYEILNMEKRA
jgi:hypothetical protein